MKFRRNESGVALVITLIMLSVITIIAVAFLALSQRERASLSQTLTATDAELMASTGLERSKSHVLAEVAAFLSTNTHAAGGRVTFYARPTGPDLTVSKAFTTNYTFYTNWTQMGNNDYQALANLFYDPQVPVFTTNRSGEYEIVDYLDLNRNGRFDPTGFVDEIDANGNRTGEEVFVRGDPQWIGVLARPNEPHSSSNRFIGRYAYIILPAGRTLDINFIHNKGKPNPSAGFAYLRSQGHGSWELNLAAFLADLNNNNPAQPYGWGGLFTYSSDLLTGATGIGFQHAFDLLNFRYDDGRLWPATNLFGAVAFDFNSDNIDQFANGSAVINNREVDNDLADTPWPGSSNPKHFFSIHDFFNPQTPSIQGFQNRLRAAGNQPDTYNAHTFYRMLAQLGTESAPEPMQVERDQRGRFNSARINLNYNNHGYDDPAGNFRKVTADQFTNWTAETFFYTAADKLLQEYRLFIDNNANTPLSVTNLPIYPTNYYTPAVHRALQVTLNIYDAMANEGGDYPYYPTALRPVFTNENSGSIVKIVGYERIPRNNWAMTNEFNWRDLSNAVDRAALVPATPNQYVYGMPILIGAKKGFPNFNQFVLQTLAQVERKVEIQRFPNGAVTNEFYYMGISNVIGLEAWNSYSNAYPRDLLMVAGIEASSVLTNNEGFVRVPMPFSAFSTNWLPSNTWRGAEFRIPLALSPQQVRGRGWTNETLLPWSVYNSVTRPPQFIPTNQWQRARNPNTFVTPQWALTTTNRLRFFLFDDGHLVDAVSLGPSPSLFKITEALDSMDQQNTVTASGQPTRNYWETNRMGNAAATQTRVRTRGLEYQIERSRLGSPPWGTGPAMTKIEKDGFVIFLATLDDPYDATRTNAWWVPFTPQQKVYQHLVWEVNDPLVHHLGEDVYNTNSLPRYATLVQPNKANDDMADEIGEINDVYEPWAKGLKRITDPRIVDPNVKGSDDWDFPTNRFATIGMLGRVHRGTPWQTVYLKSGRPEDVVWAGIHRGGSRSNPTNDWRLADVFTVAQHPNASRGRLSVNQTNMAAWSAVLSGVEVPTVQNVGGGETVVTNIVQPVAIDNPNRTIEKLVAAINTRRLAFTGQVFSSISDFLSVPQLSVDSPFIQPPFASSGLSWPATKLRDQHIEAIPEKILSLVHRGEPRFVVYAFGQSLKPAAQSILTGGNHRGLVTNYEVTGELATRTVMRVELDEIRNPPRMSPRIIVESFNFMPPD